MSFQNMSPVKYTLGSYMEVPTNSTVTFIDVNPKVEGFVRIYFNIQMYFTMNITNPEITITVNGEIFNATVWGVGWSNTFYLRCCSYVETYLNANDNVTIIVNNPSTIGSVYIQDENSTTIIQPIYSGV